jgi:hypothetical protein
MLIGAAMAQAEQARREAIHIMNNYNEARKDMFDYCMKEYGWYEVELEN